MKPQGCFNDFDMPPTLTADNLDNTTLNTAWTALSQNQNKCLLLMKTERANYSEALEPRLAHSCQSLSRFV